VRAIWVFARGSAVREFKEDISGARAGTDVTDLRVLSAGGIADPDEVSIGIAGRQGFTDGNIHVQSAADQFGGYLVKPFIGRRILARVAVSLRAGHGRSLISSVNVRSFSASPGAESEISVTSSRR